MAYGRDKMNLPKKDYRKKGTCRTCKRREGSDCKKYGPVGLNDWCSDYKAKK